MIKHPFPPLYDKDSKILVLGSFPVRKIARTIVLLRTSPKPILESDRRSIRR